MANKLQETLRSLSELAEKHEEITVAFSAGKDSLAVMELCSRTFKKVSAFYFFVVPDLEVTNRYMRLARDRWNIKVAEYPSDGFCMALKTGLYCNPSEAFANYEERNLKTVYAQSLYVTTGNITGLVATGMKAADGLKRRQFFANIDPANGGDPFWSQVHHPLKRWNKQEVLDFLKDCDIPIPPTAKGTITTGVGFAHDELCFLHDQYPDDFDKMEKLFPYIRSTIYRRKYHGVE